MLNLKMLANTSIVEILQVPVDLHSNEFVARALKGTIIKIAGSLDANESKLFCELNELNPKTVDVTVVGFYKTDSYLIVTELAPTISEKEGED